MHTQFLIDISVFNSIYETDMELFKEKRFNFEFQNTECTINLNWFEIYFIYSKFSLRPMFCFISKKGRKMKNKTNKKAALAKISDYSNTSRILLNYSSIFGYVLYFNSCEELLTCASAEYLTTVHLLTPAKILYSGRYFYF